MSQTRPPFRRLAALVAYAALASVAVLPAAAQSGPPPKTSCFFSREFENWKAPDPKTIFIRVGLTRYYRLDLAGACQSLMWPDSHLVTRFHGSDTVCSPLDWDLSVSENGFHGIQEACIVKTMTQLSPAEAQAIPKKYKP